jgi:hypothetical protein
VRGSYPLLAIVPRVLVGYDTCRVAGIFRVAVYAVGTFVVSSRTRGNDKTTLAWPKHLVVIYHTVLLIV